MLKLEVAIPAPAGMDFDCNEARPTPFLSAPSTPRPFGAYSLSAPTSPSRVADFYRRLDDEFNGGGGGGEGRSGIPFHWEERPGTPKSPPRAPSRTYVEDDFAFDFSAELEKASLSADELFDGGIIKPLKPPPGLQLDDSIDQRSPLISPRSPRSPIAKGRKIISGVFSPRKKNRDSDPFATAVENTRKGAENERGRERISNSLTRSSSRHRARSLSPYRVAEFPWEEEGEEKQQEQIAKQSAALVLNQNASTSSNSSSSSSSSSSSASKSGSKKWRLRDFLLFRSASEGRASGKDPLRRYHPNFFFRKQEEVKSTSFRSTDSESGSLRKGRVSAHELHYKTNKAASEDLKKKTFLPYKQAILGRFAFNPTIPVLR